MSLNDATYCSTLFGRTHEVLPSEKYSRSVRCVGADGFEPPKSKDSRFTVCPIWPLWNTPVYQRTSRPLPNARASSRTRTNDRWITNLVLYQLSYRGVADTLPTKKRAKVLLFFDMTKYFCKKMQFSVIFLVFETRIPHFLAFFALGCVSIYTRLICSKVVCV